MLKMYVAVTVITWAILATQVDTKVYERCELAKELVSNYKFPTDEIANWLCLIRWESNFDTGAIGKLNSDGSWDHGLFQISDKYWCSRDSVDGACGLQCSQLENEEIRDDAICAKRIYRITKFKTGNGFDAWSGWRQHCEHQDVTGYTTNCTIF